jgi:hypothetical protein
MPLDTDLQARLDRLEAKIDATFVSAEKTRKYFLITLIGTAATILLPLIGIAILAPIYLNSLQNVGGL